MFDIIYVGTNDCRVIKISSEYSTKCIVISNNKVFSINAPVNQLKLAPGYREVFAKNWSKY